MISYDFKQYCCGCGICANMCPVGAITMSKGEGEFLFPNINVDKCINCGKCDKVCPHLNAEKYRKADTEVGGTWLFASNNVDAKIKSSSGAAFFELAKHYIDTEGYVCGCVWDKELNAIHIVGSSDDDIQRMQGSKYVQSDMRDCYQKIINLLKAGKKVLFSGTPCQAVAVHAAVMNESGGKYRDQMLTVAVLCHGIPAPGTWKSYRNWIEKKNNSRLATVNFRDKSREGYKKPYCKYVFETGGCLSTPTYLPSFRQETIPSYMEAAIVYNLSIRNSCSHCDCKGITEACDLIIGDWYAECKGEGALGTSCIVSSTDRGTYAVETILDGCRKFSYAEVLRNNAFIKNSVKISPRNKEFMSKIDEDDFWDNVEQYYPSKYKYKKLLVKLHLYNLIKKIF